jgi:hypothetical protein
MYSLSKWPTSYQLPASSAPTVVLDVTVRLLQLNFAIQIQFLSEPLTSDSNENERRIPFRVSKDDDSPLLLVRLRSPSPGSM